MTRWDRSIVRPAVFGLALGVAACGGGYGGSGTPTTPGGGGGTSGPSGATVTIANGTVSPTTVTITAGQSVTFQNNDGRTRNMSSDPHPDHTQCPELNVGPIVSGQSRLSAAMNVRRTCGYHDHDDPDNASMKGQVIVQ